MFSRPQPLMIPSPLRPIITSQPRSIMEDLVREEQHNNQQNDKAMQCICCMIATATVIIGNCFGTAHDEANDV